MKKIFVIFGTRQKEGNTVKFVKKITERLDKEKFAIDYCYPQDYKIAPCVGCANCFTQTKCISDDDLMMLQEKILESDVFIIASPVYLHYFTADLKLILEKCSWWAHTLRLQGKPVVVLSTCDTNGHKTVIKPLSHIMTYMGGNVIACANAAIVPNQLNNEEWMEEVSQEIASRICKYADIPHQSNADIEKLFPYMKSAALHQKECLEKYNIDIEFGEYNYWRNTKMLEYESFDEYLKEKYKHEEVVV